MHSDIIGRLESPFSSPGMDDQQTGENAVRLNLRNVNIGESADPDEIGWALIKSLADLWAGSKCGLNKWTLKQGCLPQDWKVLAAAVIHTSGWNAKVGNRRLSSLTSVLYKLLECIIREHLCQHQTQDNKLCFAQKASLKRKEFVLLKLSNFCTR